MRFCFVSLSRKRFDYFSLVASRAPENVRADVVPGFRPNIHWFCSLLGGRELPEEQVCVHLRRQQINYPNLFRYAIYRWMYASLLRWWESVRVRYFTKVFKAGAYDAVVVWNGQKPPYSAVVVAAQQLGLRVWFFENGVLPGYTTVDPCGVNAESVLFRRPSLYLARLLEERCSPSLPKGEITVFIPLQLDSDTQVVVHSPWVRGNKELIAAVVEVFQEWSQPVRVVVRNHPLAKPHLRLREVPAPAIVDDATALSEQLKGADIVVTMNSTVGLEALAMGKPVVVTASALYGVEGVVRRADSVGGLGRALKDVAGGNWVPTRAKSFLRLLREEYGIPGDWRVVTRHDKRHFASIWARLQEGDPFCHVGNR